MLKPLEKELQALKTWDKVQTTEFPSHYKGYPKIITAGHGYLAVRKHDINEHIARKHCSEYGFVGDKAYYLEEDSEAPAFLKELI